MFCRIWRTNSRLTALAFYRMYQCRLFTAYERPCAKTYFDIQIKAAVQNVFTQQTVCPALFQRGFNSFYRKRIFSTDVEKSFCCADSQCADSHTLDNGERVAFEHRPIHKRAGITLVGIADDVFSIALLPSRHRPFQSRGITASASAAKF